MKGRIDWHVFYWNYIGAMFKAKEKKEQMKEIINNIQKAADSYEIDGQTNGRCGNNIISKS
jgi:hypothetical protein